MNNIVKVWRDPYYPDALYKTKIYHPSSDAYITKYVRRGRKYKHVFTYRLKIGQLRDFVKNGELVREYAPPSLTL